MLQELRATTQIVAAILAEDERTRNNDALLYLRVIAWYSNRDGINYLQTPVWMYLQKMKEWGLPPFESVRRARQKAQAKNPALAACDRVQAFRAANEAEYLEYAKE